jgi:hypothetical protein
MEIGHRQGADVLALCAQAALGDAAVHADLAGRDRFVIARSAEAGGHLGQ